MDIEDYLPPLLPEVVSKALEDYVNMVQISHLRTKKFAEWERFYKEFFSLRVDLKDVVIYKKWTAYMLVFVPKEVTYEKCITLLKKKVRISDGHAILDEKPENIQPLRRSAKSYKCYIDFEFGRCTILELILAELFLLWKEKKIKDNGNYGLKHTISKLTSEDEYINMRIYSDYTLKIRLF